MKNKLNKFFAVIILLLFVGFGDAWGWNLADGRKVYFNMQNQTGFGTPYFRIGRHDGGDWSAATAMTNVPGTKYLYIYTQSGTWSNYGAFSVANGKGFTNGNNIFQPWSGQPGSEGYSGDVVISKQIFFQKYDVTSDCYLEIKSANGSESNGCQYYDVNAQTSDNGGSLVTDIPMYSVTFNSSPSHGAVAVQKYTQTDGSTKESISTTDKVYPTQIIEITTTPDSYYVLDKLTVTGATLISGTTYYVTGDCEITATFAPQWSINGTMSAPEWDIYNGMTFVSDHTHRGTITLSGHTAYKFKVLDRSTTTWYGCGTRNHDYTYVGQTDAVPITSTNASGYNVLLLTTQAGEYTFEWTDDTHTLKIIYPNTISHPSMDYVYMERYSDWNSGSHCYIHYFYTDGGGDHPLTIWGTDDAKITAYTTIGGTDYYYFPILDDYPKFVVKDNVGNETASSGHKTGDMVSTDHEGQCTYYKDATEKWTWKGVQVHIALDDRGANTNVNPTYFDIDYNSAVLTDLTSIPLKDNYDFQGFYTNSDGTGTQVIDDAGQWIASVTDYTDASKHWIHPGCTTTVYAKWTETPRTITLQVSPEGAGSLSAEGSDGSTITAYISTATPTITATPSHAAWKFKRWVYGTNVGNKDGTGSDNTVQITSSANSTLTAEFEPRFTLVGSKIDNEAGGMPGWEDVNADAKAFTVVSTSPSVELTKECILEASTTYKFQIHDRIDGNFGDGTDGMYNLIEGNTAHCTNSNKDMLFTTTGAGKYIFKITAIDGSNRASVQLLWPHQTNFGRRRVDIDGTAHDDNTGGTLAVTSGGEAVSTGSWHTYGTNIAYDANNNTGYQLTWYTSSEYSSIFSAGGEWNHDLISNDNCYAQFTELATPVTLSNDGHGKVQISSEDATNTTCGITTTRSLAAVANTGYVFSSWSKSGDDINLSTTAATPTTLSSLGGGVGEGQSVTANFTPKNYTVTLHDDHGGSSNGSATVDYDATSLSVSSNARFEGWTLLGYWNTDGNQVTDASGNVQANVSNYTDASSHWNYDNNVTLYAHWSRSVTLDKNGDNGSNGSVTVTYQGSAATPSAASWSGYTVEGYYTNAACTTKVMEANGKLLESVSGYTDGSGKWTKTDATTLYTKWVKRIYRTGDNGGTAESYSGSAIPTHIEFRMKVHEAGKWYSLCLPFEVDSVCVWDDEDGHYYRLVPYYRSGDKYIKGHYVIRKPDFKTVGVDSIAISRFGEWVDPTSSAFTPVANTPYIIQWPHSYFQGRYVSFFGTSTKSSWGDMTVGDAPTDDAVVNVYGNDAMTSGSVHGAYMLDNDYGVGAWLRLEEEEEDDGGRTIPPFECYIRASGAATPLYVAIRPGMTIVDTPTGWDAISNPAEKATKVLIDGQLYIYRDGQMYTVQGTLVK